MLYQLCFVCLLFTYLFMYFLFSSQRGRAGGTLRCLSKVSVFSVIPFFFFFMFNAFNAVLLALTVTTQNFPGKIYYHASIGGSVVEFSPATRGARVRFPANAAAPFGGILRT